MEEMNSHESVERRAPGRPRSAEARQAILESTLELLKEVGFEGLSVEGIAARAGVGKATVYRWWPNKAAIVIDAFLAIVEPELRFPKGESAREVIRQQMRRLMRLMKGEFGTVLSAIIGAGQSQPELLEAIRKNWIEPRRSEARELVKDAQERGEIRADIPADTLLDILYSAFYFRLLIGHARLDEKLIDAIFDIAESGIDAAGAHPISKKKN